MEALRGKVVYVIYKSPDGYTVLDVKTNKGYVRVAGFFDEVALDTDYIFKGEWKNSRKYGPYFFASSYEVTMPDSEAGFVNFLAGFIKGLGFKKANQLVRQFGVKKLIEILDYDPDKLKEVPGIGEKTLNLIKSSWEVHRFSGRALSYLTGLGITPKMALKIYKEYGDKTKEILEENPYVLTEIWGIGFKKADSLAQQIGVKPEDPRRIRAAVIYVLEQAAESGHTYLPMDTFFESMRNLKIENYELVDRAIGELAKNGKIFLEGNIIALKSFYSMANYIFQRLKLFKETESPPTDEDMARVREKVAALARERYGVSLSTEQIEGAILPYFYNFSLITGYAGTGKSLLSKIILDLWDELGFRYEICAPTGKAAKRLHELTGRKAKTIHRLLKFNGERYEFNADNPLNVDAVLVDEVSMVSMPLFYRLLSALPFHARVVLVGDPAQLPSIGPGNLLTDLLNMEFPSVTLKHVYRQGPGSSIALNARNIREGKLPEIANNEDFIVKYFEKNEDFVEPLKRAIVYFGNQIQLITPQRRGILGTKNLNFIAQGLLNPPASDKVEIQIGERVFREGDRIIQIVNDYERVVFNGEIGEIFSIDKENGMAIVRFEDGDGERFIEYTFEELRDETDHAYALTVHKAQGSEFDVALLVMSLSHYVFLHRNWFYTAITRAKRVLTLFAHPRAIQIAVKNVKPMKRYTLLSYLSEKSP